MRLAVHFFGSSLAIAKAPHCDRPTPWPYPVPSTVNCSGGVQGSGGESAVEAMRAVPVQGKSCLPLLEAAISKVYRPGGTAFPFESRRSQVKGTVAATSVDADIVLTGSPQALETVSVAAIGPLERGLSVISPPVPHGTRSPEIDGGKKLRP